MSPPPPVYEDGRAGSTALAAGCAAGPTNSALQRQNLRALPYEAAEKLPRVRLRCPPDHETDLPFQRRIDSSRH